MRSKTIGLLHGSEVTRVYAPRKRTVAVLSKHNLPGGDERLMHDDNDAEGNVTRRWEDKVYEYANHYYLPFPWIVFHRFFRGDGTLNCDLFVALLKRLPESLDEPIYPVPLPNVDRNYYAYQCTANTLPGNIELFWASYFMKDEHPYGTHYGQALFGLPVEFPPMSGPVPFPLTAKLRNANQNYLEDWAKLEPEEMCEKLEVVGDYPAATLGDLVMNEGLARNWLDAGSWLEYRENYKLMVA